MSKAGLNRSFDRSSVNFPPTVEPKASQTEALLREAINTAKPPRLRLLLQDLCNRPPDPRTVTAALLIITGERFKKLEQSDESDTKKEDNGDEDSKDEAASESSNEEEDDSESEIALEDGENGNDHGSSDDEENEASDGKIARKDNEVKHPTESSNDEDEYSESELANNDTAYKRVLKTDGSRDGLTGRK